MTPVRCLYCDGSRWRQWYLCLPCVRMFLDYAKAGRHFPDSAETRTTRQTIARARYVAVAYGRH